MTNQELKTIDLCGRLPYGVIGVADCGIISPLIERGEADFDIITSIRYRTNKHGWRPYLRRMDSMTDEEQHAVNRLIGREKCTNKYGDIHCYNNGESVVDIVSIANYIDWLNAHHFDYRGLIDKGLALEAPDGMYNIK